MENIIVRKQKWEMFGDSTGDRQMIHRDLSRVDPEILKKYNITKEFAPGMYIASFIQGWPCIQSVKSIRFEPTRIYDGDVVKVVALPNIVGKGIDYSFSKGEDIVCKVNGVKFGDPDGKEVKIMNDVCYEHLTDIDPAKVSYFLGSLGYSIEDGRPNMFLASKFAPALLAYGESKGVGDGVYATQSFNSHLSYEHGPLSILVGDERIHKTEEGELKRYKVQAVQNNKVVVSGRSSIGVLEKIAA